MKEIREQIKNPNNLKYIGKGNFGIVFKLECKG